MKNILYILAISIIIGSCSSKDSAVGPNSNTGKGGSTARFTIAYNTLYIVDNQSLRVFNITDPTNPTYIKKVPLNTVVETIFPFNNHLLIGTQTGMFIFNISNPESPQKVSVFTHVVSCDPVVAEGDFAFVTLRSGTACNRGINVLDVIDIKNLGAPKLVKSYTMLSPHGLGVDGNLLFVTEGVNGMKVFDRTNPLDLKEITTFKDFNAVDVITDANTLIVTGSDGVYQYSYEDKKVLKLLSKIPVEY